MKKIFVIIAVICLICQTASAVSDITIEINHEQGKDTGNIILALKKAAGYKGKPVTIKLSNGIYELERSESTHKIYYISNTTTEEENPDQTKHIGVYLDSLENITIDGCGSTLMMGGEMTGFVFDRCKNIVLKNINIDYKYPTQTEMEVVEEGDDYIVAKVHPTSQYRISGGQLEWYGDGWSFKEGIAQSYDRKTNMTWRSWCPLDDVTEAKEVSPGVIYLKYKSKPAAGLHTVFQMRDSYRDEVCGFINRSKDIKLENINFYYLGNFGVVCQYSENIEVTHCRFAPCPDSGRTNAGFADFIQVSGCKGTVVVKDSFFSGAHDDPINVHGTHLHIERFISPKQLKVRFMHGQTFGFEAFRKGDAIEIVNARTLLAASKAKITDAKMLSPREMELTLSKAVPEDVMQLENLVVENVTWTPKVMIADNYFERIPTRGILITTRRKSVIENNTFCGIQMSGILIADDGMSWYESGPVHNMTIRKNIFINCGEPVINIEPENNGNKDTVHKNIVIKNNLFNLRENSSTAIRARAVKGLKIRNNVIYSQDAGSFMQSAETGDGQEYIQVRDCVKSSVRNNFISSSGICL